jgi:hypothetical protein
MELGLKYIVLREVKYEKKYMEENIFIDNHWSNDCTLCSINEKSTNV